MYNSESGHANRPSSFEQVVGPASVSLAGKLDKQSLKNLNQAGTECRRIVWEGVSEEFVRIQANKYCCANGAYEKRLSRREIFKVLDLPGSVRNPWDSWPALRGMEPGEVKSIMATLVGLGEAASAVEKQAAESRRSYTLQAQIGAAFWDSSWFLPGFVSAAFAASLGTTLGILGRRVLKEDIIRVGDLEVDQASAIMAPFVLLLVFSGAILGGWCAYVADRKDKEMKAARALFFNEHLGR